MRVFVNEINDGLGDIINNNVTLAFASEAVPVTRKQFPAKQYKTLASYDDDDLYYVQSLLVSSSWNKNDDVFSAVEVWRARKTPEDKPTNLEHSEDQIVGHIISNWTVDSKGETIDENINESDLPSEIHIITGSVIYKNFADEALRSRAQELISEIEQGVKYVSMECYFDNFDYGLVDKTSGDYKIINRNDKTSYLTKHLRSYGGTGEIENYKIGRVLRNIKFSGKGYVNKPANPESIIFNKHSMASLYSKQNNEKNNPLESISVSSIQHPSQNGELSMSSEIDLEKVMDKISAMDGCASQIKEAYSKVTELESELREIKAAYKKDKEDSEKKQSEMSETIAQKDKELEDEKNKMQHDVAQLNEGKTQEISELTKAHAEVVKAKDEEISKLNEQLVASNEIIDSYKTKEAEMLKQNQILARINDLVEAGVSKEAAEATVDKFEHLDDESFAAVKTLLASKTPELETTTETSEAEVVADAETEASETDEETTYADDAEVLETAEASEDEVALAVGGSDSEMESTRASLVNFVCSRLSKSTK